MIDNVNGYLVQALISLLKGYKLHSNSKRQNDYKYLASQCIRQYILPAEHCHVSLSANELWNRLTSMKIREHGYRDKIVCDKLAQEVVIKAYSGASNKGRETVIHPGGAFIFNDLFHGDHVVPVSFILKRLVALPDASLTPEVVTNELDEMHICIITKEEDHRIGRTRNRYPTFEKTISEGAYRDIKLI